MSILDTIAGNIDGNAFSKSLILRQLKRKIDERFRKLGKQRIQQAITDNEGLEVLISEIESPADIEKARAWLKNRPGISSMVTEQEIVRLIPEWVGQIILLNGDKGKIWLRTQVVWIRSLLSGGS